MRVGNPIAAKGNLSPGHELPDRNVFEPATLGAGTAGEEQDDVAREMAELERQHRLADRPAHAQEERGCARAKGGDGQDAVRRKRPRFFEPLRADRGAQGDIGGGEDQQRLDEPHRPRNDRAMPNEPKKRR
jgi:hypothetical protein